MNAIRKTKELNDRELENCTSTSASWHRDYKDTAFIYIGGLDLRLSEGDVITIFSQYGEPDFVNLVRDKETGKSKGFAFLRYQDQRSTDLAVDNLSGASVMGRMLNVEHTRYKKRDDEELADNTKGFLAPGAEEAEEESDDEPDRPLLEEEKQLAKLLRDVDDEDPMKGELVRAKKEEVERALRKLKAKEERRKERRHHRHDKESRSSHRKSRHDRAEDDDRRERTRKRRRSRSREARD